MKRLVVALCLLMALPSWAGYGTGAGSKVRPQLSAPDSMFVAIGQQFNIFNKGLSHSPAMESPFGFSYDNDVPISVNGHEAGDRAYQVTPIAMENFDVGVYAIDYHGKTLASESIAVRAVPSSAGFDKGDKQILLIGDSVLAEGTEATELAALFTAGGGGVCDLIGTKGTGAGLHEGISGWTAARFATTITDNPFWDTVDGEIDFQWYMSDNLFTGDLDYIAIQLGINDMAILGTSYATSADISSVLANYDILIDAALSAVTGYPSCKVLVVLEPIGSGLTSGVAYDYGVADWWRYYEANMRSLHSALIARYDAGAYHANVDVAGAHLGVDRDYCYQYTEASRNANSRAANYVAWYSGYVHPNVNGKKQLADVIYGHVRYWMLEGEDCVNSLPNSWDFTNTSYWGALTSYFDVVAGQADPWGGTTAVSYTVKAGQTGEWAAFSHTVSSGPTSNKTVCSIFAKEIAVASASATTALRIYDEASTNIGAVQITWAATPVASTFVTAIPCTANLADIGSGWYRLDLELDTTNYIGSSFRFQIGPVYAGGVPGDEVHLAGANLNHNVTSNCGAYVQTP